MGLQGHTEILFNLLREDPLLFEVDGEFFVKGGGHFPIEDPEVIGYPLQKAGLCLMA